MSLETNSNVNWFKLLNPNNLNEIFIVLGFKDEYSKKFDNFYKFLSDLTNEYDEIIIQYTGGLIIDYESNFRFNGAVLAGLLSLFFVSIILWIYFKNLYVIFILVASIIIGLIITIGFGTIFCW